MLQLSSNHREFSIRELEDNLKLILRGRTHENISMRTLSVYRQVDERKELINGYVAKKRKASLVFMPNELKSLSKIVSPFEEHFL